MTPPTGRHGTSEREQPRDRESRHFLRVGIDVGGTFTDFALQLRDGTVISFKRLSNPDNPVDAIVDGLARLLTRCGETPEELRELVHATTRGSNAIIERRGGPTGLVTTAGFRDMLEIQRSLRYSMYDVQIEKQTPLVPRSRVWEVAERTLADGSIDTELQEEEVRALVPLIRASGIRSLAISYLHAYANPKNEQRTRDIIQTLIPDMPVAVSSEISLLGREYERTSSAVAAAYLIPVLSEYLDDLIGALVARGVNAPAWVMHSAGGMARIDRAIRNPLHTLESSPAAGVLMGARQSARAGIPNVITLEMGGTTAKAAVVFDGKPARVRQLEVDRIDMNPGSGLPVDIPAVDLVEIGSGGGSIAHAQFDVLSVGPESAGADPGPVCYGRGGNSPTVTDANVVLGYLNPAYFAGGTIALDEEAAFDAISRLGRELGLDPLRTAWGIYELATLQMEQAIRFISIGRDLDPRDFALVAMGGAGPVHACDVGRGLGIPTVIIPWAAGVASAVGLLAADESLELSKSARIALDDASSIAEGNAVLRELEAEAAAVLELGPNSSPTVSHHRSVGARYVGQGHEVELSIPPGELIAQDLRASFADLYERIYGYRYPDDAPIEAVTWYLSVTRELGRPALSPLRAQARLIDRKTTLIYRPDVGRSEVPVYWRADLQTGHQINGPCLVEEEDTTTVLGDGDRAAIDENLNLQVFLAQPDSTP